MTFAYLLKNKITSTDIDSVLMIGDQIYKHSYVEAIKFRSKTLTQSKRLNRHLAAHEIQKDIFLTINRLNITRLKIKAQPISEKEYSGKFNKFAKTYI